MKYNANLSNSQEKKINNLVNKKYKIKKSIFREYEKKLDKFVATNRFFIPELYNECIVFNSFDIDFLYQNSLSKRKDMLRPFEDNKNIYVCNNNNYYNLVILSNIEFSLDDTNINKNDIFQKYIETNNEIDDNLLKDLYYNEEFSKKINIQLPKKYNDKVITLEDVEIKNKYLFKINIIELNRSFYQESNILV